MQFPCINVREIDMGGRYSHFHLYTCIGLPRTAFPFCIYDYILHLLSSGLYAHPRRSKITVLKVPQSLRDVWNTQIRSGGRRCSSGHSPASRLSVPGGVWFLPAPDNERFAGLRGKWPKCCNSEWWFGDDIHSLTQQS